MVAGYVIAAAYCARAASAPPRKDGAEGGFGAIWWLLASGLLGLGINKQLNLQTLLIVLGRRAALAGGWYEQRRMVQTIFSAALTVAGLAALWLLRARFRRFFAGNPLALRGVVVLFLFVMIRAASINHVFERLGIPQDDEHDDKRWAWVLEIGGSACLTLAAIKARNENGPPR